jgi:hypothetical protein
MATKKPDKRFDPTVLDRTVIARPLLEQLDERGDNALFDVVIDVNMNYRADEDGACARRRSDHGRAGVERRRSRGQHRDRGDHRKTDLSDQYVSRVSTGEPFAPRASTPRQAGGAAEFAAR